MPSEVSITTKKRFKGSGPKNEENAPGISDSTDASPFSDSVNPPFTESTAAMIDTEVKRIVTEAFETAKRLLTENIDKLHFISEFLIKNEIMDEYQFEAAMNGSATTVEELEAIREQHKRDSQTENEEKAKREADERKAREEEERRRLDELLGRVDPNHQPRTKSGSDDNNNYPQPPEGSDNK